MAYELSKEDFEKFLRCEVEWNEIVPKDVYLVNYPPVDIPPTFDDVLHAAEKYGDKVGEKWLGQLWWLKSNGLAGCFTEPGDICGVRSIPLEGYYVGEMLGNSKLTDVDVVERVEKARAEMLKPVSEREFDETSRFIYFRSFDFGEDLSDATDAELALFRRLADESAEKSEEVGLRIKAYSYYSGNKIYEQDFRKSREYLIKLYEVSDDPSALNSLGYIAYYGRCGDEPDYAEAFRCFSRAAWRGVIEAKYKIADMYKNGYFVEKDDSVHRKIIRDVYRETVPEAANGHFTGEFADAALRMASISFDDGDTYEAARCCLLAEFALRRRMEQADFFGDKVVANRVRDLKEKIYSNEDYWTSEEKGVFVDLEDILSQADSVRPLFEANFKRIDEDRYRVTFRACPFDGEEHPAKLFIAVPDARWCGMLDEVVVEAECVLDGDWNSVDFDEETILFDCFDSDNLYFGREHLIDFDEPLHILLPEEETHRFASVRFETGGRLYDYLCDDFPEIEADDFAEVVTDDGKKKVKVVSVRERKLSEMSLPSGRYKSLERIL